MTANIIQNIIPRSHSDFRSSLRYVRKGKHRRSPSTLAPAISFRVRSIGQQLGSIDSHAITVSLGLLALITVAMLGFFYLQQVLSTASQGTDIHALENQISSLKDQQRQLELQGAELRSLKTIENNVQKLNLVATDKVSYLSGTSDRVALGGEISAAANLPH